MRVAEELRGISASLRVAANRSSIGLFLSRAIALSRARRPEYFLLSLLRRLFFSIELFFAINVSCFPPWRMSSLPEREVERAQQRARLCVGLRAGAHGDVHSPDIGHLVVVDLGEDDMFLDADRVISAAIEAFRRQPAEVAHPRQRDVDQPVDELVHARLAQRHLAADRLAVAHLEGGDRLSGFGDHRLLAGDEAEITGGGFDLLAVVDAFADAHIDDHFLDHRHLHAVLVAELIGELLAHDLLEMGFEPRRDALLRLSRLGARRVALRSRFARLRLRTLLCLLRLVALRRPRRFIGCRAFVAFAFALRLSHRSQLPTAWPPAPCADSRPPPRT